MFIAYSYLHLLCSCFRGAHSPIKCKWFSKRSIWLIDGILADINTVDLGVIIHSPDLQNWSLTIRYSLVLYSGHIFLGGWVLPICRRYSQHFLSPTDREFFFLDNYKILTLHIVCLFCFGFFWRRGGGIRNNTIIKNQILKRMISLYFCLHIYFYSK